MVLAITTLANSVQRAGLRVLARLLQVAGGVRKVAGSLQMAPTQARRLRPVSASLAGVGRQVGAARAPEPLAGSTVVFSVQRQLARPRSGVPPAGGKSWPREFTDLNQY